MFNAARYTFALLALLVALLILALAKIFFNVPKPLLLFSAATYALSFVIFVAIYRIQNHSKRNKTALLVVAWLVTTVSMLAVLYRWDRAGWLWFQATGYDVVLAEKMPEAHQMPLATFLQNTPLFSLSSDSAVALLLKKGTYDVDRTLVVPSGTIVRIEPGTILRFGAGASLISYSPIIAVGSEQQPIVFTSQDLWRKWGSVGVVTEQRSVFRHTVFENGRRAQVNGIDFWGALALIGTNAEISHSHFRNLHGKDGVNVAGGNVLIHDNLFQNCHKDGLDLDGGEGLVYNNTFIDCDDEGIDLSENQAVRVYANTILDARGGRLGAEQNYEDIIAANSFGYSNKNNKSN